MTAFLLAMAVSWGAGLYCGWRLWRAEPRERAVRVIYRPHNVIPISSGALRARSLEGVAEERGA